MFFLFKSYIGPFIFVLFMKMQDAEDCVTKFTSLVRAKDLFPNHRSW